MNDKILLSLSLCLIVLDFFISIIGSIGFFGIIDLTDIVSSINKFLSFFVCLFINAVIPIISVLVFDDILSNKNSQNYFQQLSVKVFFYPILIAMDFYTTFLGVGQLFILDGLSKYIKLESFQINFVTIRQNSSFEQLLVNTVLSIFLLIGHFLLAVVKFKSKSLLSDELDYTSLKKMNSSEYGYAQNEVYGYAQNEIYGDEENEEYGYAQNEVYGYAQNEEYGEEENEEYGDEENEEYRNYE